MIEFLPPRDGAFGHAEVADFVGFDGDGNDAFEDEPPRSRWLTALAVVGVTGLLAGGVIAASPWGGDDVATAPTTTVPTTTPPTPPTTQPGSTATTEPGLPPGVSADVPGMLPAGPSRFVLAWAESAVGRLEAGADVGNRVEVWMSPDASRNTGKWIVIVSQELTGGSSDWLRRDAIRVEAGPRPALLFARSDGVVEIDVPVSEGAPFTVAGFGVGLAELIRIAATVRIDPSGIDHGDLLTPGGPFDGLEQRAAEHVAWFPGGFATPTADAISGFVDPTGNQWIQVNVAPPNPTTQLLDELVGTVPVDRTELSLIGLGGLFSLSQRFDSVTVVRSRLDEGIGIVSFVLRDGRIVRVAGNMNQIDELLTFASDLELAAPEAWEDAVIEATTAAGVVSGATTSNTEIGGSLNGQWQAEVYGSADAFQVHISGTEVAMGETFDPDPGPQLTIYRSIDKAFILATNTWPNEGRRVVITQPGLEPQDLPLVQIPDTAIHALIVELDATLPYEVQWRDRWGAPVGEPTQAGP